MDIRGVFEQQIPAQLARHPDLPEQVDAVLQVEIDGDGGGVWVIDLTRANGPPRVVSGPHPAPKVRVRIEESDFVDLMCGRQRWTDAFVQGKIDFRGDLVTALKLRKLFATHTGME